MEFAFWEKDKVVIRIKPEGPVILIINPTLKDDLMTMIKAIAGALLLFMMPAVDVMASDSDDIPRIPADRLMTNDELVALLDPESDSELEKSLLSNLWEWEFTQYDSERGSQPPGAESYVVRFEDRGKFRVTAACGKKTGKFSLRRRSIQIEMKRLNWFGCRKDESLQVFFGDLQRGSEFFISEGQLKITLTTDSGIMYFKKR